MEAVLSSILDIQITNFRESLKLAQRALFTGFIVAGTAFHIGNTKTAEKLPNVPFLNIEFGSIEALQIALLLIYVGAGVIALFASHRAEKTLVQIGGPDLVKALSRTPCLIVSGPRFQPFLWGFLGGGGYLLVYQTSGVGSVLSFFAGLVVTGPFFISVRIGNDIYRMGN